MLTVVITAGEYRATIVNEGAGLASLTRAGRAITLGHEPARRPRGYIGKVLIPWPNRIREGIYRFQGTEYRLPPNEATGAALHGLQCWSQWAVVSVASNSIILESATEPTPGYPFSLRSTVTYTLDPETGLTVEITTTNTGVDDAPYGVGTHCYLTCDGAPLDRCIFQISARDVLTVDQDMIPVGRVPASSQGLDFSSSTSLRGRVVDHAFTGLPELDSGTQWVATLSDPTTGMTVEMIANEPWVQVFSADTMGRNALAVEPMTCPPDAFNSGQDLIVLVPGQSHTTGLTIREQD